MPNVQEKTVTMVQHRLDVVYYRLGIWQCCQ
ncbi:Uncharacterised protein [Salmonella bongori]|nr:Uncharacterised protein [Salmonella bongori]